MDQVQQNQEAADSQLPRKREKNQTRQGKVSKVEHGAANAQVHSQHGDGGEAQGAYWHCAWTLGVARAGKTQLRDAR